MIDSQGMRPLVFNEALIKSLGNLINAYTSFPPVPPLPPPPIHWVLEEMDKQVLNELTTDSEYRSTYIDQVKQSGLTGIRPTIGAFGQIPFSYEAALSEYARMIHRLDLLDEGFKMATRAAQVRQAKKEGKVAVFLNFQNTKHFGENLEQLDFFYRQGIRQMQLTYNTRNLVGDRCTERNDGGLSRFGIQVIERMNQREILVDISHASIRTALEAIEVSKAPVIISHTNCRALNNHVRCMPDEVFHALAEKRGYIGLTVVAPFVNIEKVNRNQKITVMDWLAHVNHLIDLIGVNYVGIGTDDNVHEDVPPQYRQKIQQLMSGQFSQMGFRPEDRVADDPAIEGTEHFVDVYSTLIRALVLEGYSDQEIAKIIGENYLSRVKQVMR